MQKIKNIIFDLGGVLLDIDYNLTRQAFESLGVQHFDQLYSQAHASRLFQNLEKGTIEAGEFFKELNRCTGLALSEKEIRHAWNAMLLDFRESSLQYLLTLKSKTTLLLLSNTNIIHKEAFYEIYYQKPRALSFDDHFHHCIFSYQAGMRKPDVACYRRALGNLNLLPGETLFIDDSVQNVEGASGVGIQTILLDKGAMIEDLSLEQRL